MIQLNNGLKMPVLGYGVYQVTPDECKRCVGDALEVGYRMVDTAQAYGNEAEVGAAINDSGLKREDVFIVTKIWVTNAGEQRAADSIQKSLEKLKTDYLDLLLIHQPFGDYYGTYRAMEAANDKGLVKAIGVSNFYADRFIDLAAHCRIKPAVNQMETHVFQQQQSLRPILEKNKTTLMSWGPFAEGRNNFFDTGLLKSIGRKYDKRVAQVALRFLIQNGIIVIPKSVNKERMQQNIDVFNFELSEQDMLDIRGLDTAESAFFSHYDPTTVEFILNYKV